MTPNLLLKETSRPYLKQSNTNKNCAEIYNQNMSTLLENATAKAKHWLNSNIDEASKDEVKRLLSDKDPKELIDSFYKDLEFGTGGLRGIMGVGANCMNQYTVGAATQGLANYLKKS